MKRSISQDLLDWKLARGRPPLLLKGARQVGKTHILKEFGLQNFLKVHYVNFERDLAAHAIFSRDLKVLNIIRDLSLHLDTQIDINRDLVIFDEVQLCSRALTSLKYFREELPSLAVCAAGSLLGVTLLEDSSFPVGKVDIIEMFPMTFYEFLEAVGTTDLLPYVTDLAGMRDFSEILHGKLWEYFLRYLVVGGLPQVVSTYVENRDNEFEALTKVRARQEMLLASYHSDFTKHCGKVNAMHLQRVLHSVPQQLAACADGSVSRFKFRGVIPGISQYSRLVGALDWLKAAGLVIKIPIVDNANLPLVSKVQENKFKLYLFDVGLLGALAELKPATIMQYAYGTYKGFVAENFVAQALAASRAGTIYGWHEHTAEIEFVKDLGEYALPIEVKAGSVTRSKSLSSYVTRYRPKRSLILSAKPPKVRPMGVGGLVMLPIYCAEKAIELVSAT